MVRPTAPPSAKIPLPMEQIEAFCRKWNLVEFSLFGSVLRDDFGPDSDVDVLVRFDPSAHPRPTLLTLAGMERELEGLFERRVDFLEWEGVEQTRNPYFHRSVVGSAQTVYATEKAPAS